MFLGFMDFGHVGGRFKTPAWCNIPKPHGWSGQCYIVMICSHTHTTDAEIVMLGVFIVLFIMLTCALIIFVLK